ncbi:MULTISPECIES: hypothetical protein [unclassified Phaeobacter]|uniref:hypothetical protein n=1 Tax=unclassified Phaeobacter TaxID=2621772 RepID=UPI003A8499B7
MRLFRSILATSSLVLLAACQPPVPESGPEAGFGSSPFDRAPATGTTINGDPLVPPVRVAAAGSSDDIARETAAALAAARGNSGTAPIEASPSNPAPALAGNPRISDENDFDAVASRQSIESDAERLARQRAQYQVVSPTAVPERSGDRDPNIVRYALSTSNPRGQRIYSRSGFNLAARSSRNCAGFASPELAQIAFLEAGGPKRDRQALDPDGDGYACGWDPAPYRLAVQN